MIRWIKWTFVVVVTWLANGTGVGTVRGEDIQVNTYTTGSQGSASVALDAVGNFVVVWRSFGSGGTDSDGSSIQGQRFASDGSTVGGEFQINTYTTKNQGLLPSVAMGVHGDFVVVWSSYGSAGTDSSVYSVQGQRYASDGSTVGSQFQVNTTTTGNQFLPSVAVDAAGDFVVVWDSRVAGFTEYIQGQRYASSGSPLGDEFQVNSYTTYSQLFPSVAAEADGDFVVVWYSGGSSGTDSSDGSIQGQRYTSDGTLAGDEFQINTYTSGTQGFFPSVAMAADGGFVVVWRSVGSIGKDCIQGQRFASDGSAVAGEFQVNTTTTGSQLYPSVAVAADGDFVVVWSSEGSGGTDSSQYSIQGQRYSSDGSSVGGEFQVNTYTTDDQNWPSVSIDAIGDFVVTWHSFGSGGTDTDGASIQVGVFHVIFADGFESGDTSAWR